MSRLRSTPYLVLALGVPSAELEAVERELAGIPPLWIDHVEAADDLRAPRLEAYDLAVVGAPSAQGLAQAAAALAPLREGRARRLPVLAVLSPGAEGKARVAGTDRTIAGPLRAAPLRSALALVEDVPCPEPVDDTMADLVDEYLANRRADVPALRAALEAGDRAAVARRAHRFKGTGAIYGFPEISRSGEGIERAAQGGSERELWVWIDALDRYLADVAAAEKEGG